MDILNTTINSKMKNLGAYESFFGTHRTKQFFPSPAGLQENKANPMLKKTKNLVTPYEDDPLKEIAPTQSKQKEEPLPDNRILMSGTVSPSKQVNTQVNTPTNNLNLGGSLQEDQEDQPNPHNVLNHGEPFGGRNKVRSLMVLDEGGNPIRYYKSKSAFTKDSGKRVSKTFNTVGEQLTLIVNSERLTLVAITLKDYNERVA